MAVRVRDFPIARMTADLRTMTVALCFIPVILGIGAAITQYWVQIMLGIAAVLVVLLYIALLLAFRPRSFQVSERGLRIIWPIRSELLKTARLKGVERITRDGFRQRYGLGARVGAGGMWGGFGLYKTKTVTFRMFTSRTDEAIVVYTTGRPLLITPADLEGFVTALADLIRPAETPAPSDEGGV